MSNYLEEQAAACYALVRTKLEAWQTRKDIVTVARMLTYQGPAREVMACLERSIQGTKVFGQGPLAITAQTLWSNASLPVQDHSKHLVLRLSIGTDGLSIFAAKEMKTTRSLGEAQVFFSHEKAEEAYRKWVEESVYMPEILSYEQMLQRAILVVY